MNAHARTVCASLTSAALALGGVSAATAAPQPLTDQQLDGVNAGAISVWANAGANATGLFVFTGTSTNAIAAPGAGVADGIALSVGTNLGQSGPPAGSTTTVQTGGSTGGAPGYVETINFTTHGAGGLTLQIGWTAAFAVPTQ
jgi:hypothetical protein